MTKGAYQRPDLSSDYVAPETSTERVLAEIWQEFFGIDQIGTLDNFFDLGGDSLSATRMISRVRSLFGTDLPPSTLFTAPTIGEFASYMTAREARPGLTEKTACLVERIGGMSQEEVSRNLQATTAVA
jgi:acyl carrier protein